MVFAGLWESWKSPEGEKIESCTILTTSSNKLIEPLHDRMPVILHPQEYDNNLSTGGRHDERTCRAHCA